VVCNFTQVIRENYRIGIPRKGKLKEIFNSDAKYMEEVQLKFAKLAMKHHHMTDVIIQ
jgi:1,4-alpha-glucan branching enzyme